MPRVRAALIGVGNCASALVQGVHMYRSIDDSATIPGVASPRIGPYHIGDIEWVAAFDVSRRKVGKDLADAIFQPPNKTPRFTDLPSSLGVTVSPGPVLDGVAPHMRARFDPIDYEVGLGEVVDVLKSSGAEIVVNLLPVGSTIATSLYAEAALEAGAGFVNGIPVFIASSREWGQRYASHNLPLVGDDIKGQLGATILHRTLVRLMHMRGVKVEATYQLNIGGNTDFENMLAQERLRDKKISKTRAVTSVLPYGRMLEDQGSVMIGPSGMAPFLGNTKVAHIYIEGRSFAGFPVRLYATLEVDDKSMFAGAMIDAIRGAKIALDRGIGGPIPSVSAPFFKHPPQQADSDEEAYRWFMEFLEGRRSR